MWQKRVRHWVGVKNTVQDDGSHIPHDMAQSYGERIVPGRTSFLLQFCPKCPGYNGRSCGQKCQVISYLWVLHQLGARHYSWLGLWEEQSKRMPKSWRLATFCKFMNKKYRRQRMYDRPPIKLFYVSIIVLQATACRLATGCPIRRPITSYKANEEARGWKESALYFVRMWRLR